MLIDYLINCASLSTNLSAKRKHHIVNVQSSLHKCSGQTADIATLAFSLFPYGIKSHFPILHNNNIYNLGPVVQSIVSLTSLLVVKMLTVLVNTISNSQLFLLKKFE